MSNSNEAVDFSSGDGLMIDFNGVEDAGFEVMPRGVYEGVISEVEFKYSASAGNPMWSVQLEVEEPSEYAGRKLFCNMVFAGEGMKFTKRYLSRVAPSLLEGPFNPQDQDVINSMLGLRCGIKVGIQKYDGEDRNNVKDLIAPKGGSDSFM